MEDSGRTAAGSVGECESVSAGPRRRKKEKEKEHYHAAMEVVRAVCGPICGSVGE